MSAVDDANARLDAALSRLESTLQTHLAAPDKVSAAQAERVRIEQEMKEVRGEFASLKKSSTEVAQRLDTAIGKVKELLAE